MDRVSGRTPLFLFCSLVVLLAGRCSTAADPAESPSPQQNAELLHGAVGDLTDVMVRDVFSPPQAARAYAYASVAAYEALGSKRASAGGAPDAYRSLAGQLNGLKAAPAPDSTQRYDFALASLEAFLRVGQAMVYSEPRVEALREKMHAHFEARGVPQAVRARSVAHGEAVAQHVLDWADADRYKETRSGPRFTVTDEPGRWRPTPPAYMEGVNPNWNKIRPFVMDSSAQFRPPPPVPYSMEDGSAFRAQVEEVYRLGKDLSEEEREIAAFWDCNPYVMNTRGHAMFATKQMTPGGHWMGIAAIAARQTEAGLASAAAAYARLGVALSDGFISAWDEKYRSNLVRPVTVINEHLDEDWRPVLQTPPFPEYTSAHSAVSAAAAATLTDVYGEGFAFRDTSEVRYGLPVRSFSSFAQAADEAAMSRLYGGIHYPMAAENGYDQGKQLGRFLVDEVETRRPAVAAQGRPPATPDSAQVTPAGYTARAD